jgi:hypothetical protein
MKRYPSGLKYEERSPVFLSWNAVAPICCLPPPPPPRSSNGWKAEPSLQMFNVPPSTRHPEKAKNCPSLPHPLKLIDSKSTQSTACCPTAFQRFSLSTVKCVMLWSAIWRACTPPPPTPHLPRLPADSPPSPPPARCCRRPQRAGRGGRGHIISVYLTIKLPYTSLKAGS